MRLNPKDPRTVAVSRGDNRPTYYRVVGLPTSSGQGQAAGDDRGGPTGERAPEPSYAYGGGRSQSKARVVASGAAREPFASRSLPLSSLAGGSDTSETPGAGVPLTDTPGAPSLNPRSVGSLFHRRTRSGRGPSKLPKIDEGRGPGTPLRRLTRDTRDQQRPAVSIGADR
jgi:hypothetical protein